MRPAIVSPVGLVKVVKHVISIVLLVVITEVIVTMARARVLVLTPILVPNVDIYTVERVDRI